MGSPSFTRVFQIPVSRIAELVVDAPKPHDRYMAAVTPTPSAPPPGIVLATAVDDSVTTTACGYVSPGVATRNTNA